CARSGGSIYNYAMDYW
nr:immunoglobulin heavy chain junction region [Mus musculus]